MTAYPDDILAEDERRRAAARSGPPTVEARIGLEVTHRVSGFRGTVVRAGAAGVEVRALDGVTRRFPLTGTVFLVAGKPASLVPPRPRPPAGPAAPTRTASGSIATEHEVRVARGSRLLVEGVHDAELVEQVWGDDLRYVGVVVERLDGLDHLDRWVDAFRPGPGRRLGVLVDHLLPGTKEWRIVERVRHPHLLVTGTPYVDVWQAVKPSVLGIDRWPDVPKGTDWKAGICDALGAPDPRTMWRALKSRVRSYADLEPSFVGAVERLVDFVTAEDVERG